MVNKDPLLTVYTASMNKAAYIMEALEGLRRQTYANIELIIIDDCSRDNSVQLIQDWTRKNSFPCDLVVHKDNVGICRTVNEIFSRAHGDYFAAMGVDDIWADPRHLERQLRFLQSAPPEIGVVYSDATRIDRYGQVLPQTFIEFARGKRPPPEGDVFTELLEGNFIPAMAAMVRKNCYEKVGPFDERLFFEDWDIWLRISQFFRFAYLKQESVKYRVLSDSASSVLFSGSNFATRSFMIMFGKCLLSSKLCTAERQNLAKKVLGYAETLYKTGGQVPISFALLALRYRPKLRDIGILICVLLKIPYSLINRITRLKSRFK